MTGLAPLSRAQVQAQNKRKIEKDKRRKLYHDSQVQGTNNSSIVSKRSVEALYLPTMEPGAQEWFKHFVPKWKRRSPAINRGYWLRMESIKQSVLRIQQLHGQVLRVVNLGCGFDPLAFKLLAEYPGRFRFYDLDYPDLVARKLDMINASPEILAAIGLRDQPSVASTDVLLSTASYKLVGCDLKNLELYAQQLARLLPPGEPTLFIAEVSLAYMLPEHANPVIELLAKLPNSHLLVLEQIMPAGPDHFFAQKMLYHFSHLRSPLLCVETYHTKELQKARFQQYLPHVDVVDLFGSWQQLVSSAQKAQVAQVEEFDEWEEFLVFCQHYVVIHATNSTVRVFSEEYVPPTVEEEATGFEMTPLTGPQIKFAAAAESELLVYLHGGLFQSRSSDLTILSPDNVFSAVTMDGPSPRMCHTLTSIGPKRLILVGGRTRPGQNLSDVWLLDSGAWRLLGNLPQGLSRHSAFQYGPDQAVVFAHGRFTLIFVECSETNPPQMSLQDLGQSDLGALQSCGLTYDQALQSGYIFGGMADAVAPNVSANLYQFSLGGGTVRCALVDTLGWGRIGCILRQQGDALYIIGGAGPTLTDQDTSVLRYSVSRKILARVRLPDNVWKTGPVLVGSVLAGDVMLGGGAVCYSFGSAYNCGYRLTFAD